MADYFKARLTPMNPLPERVLPADRCPEDATGEEMARDGYSVLDRADPRNPYNRNRRGLAPPVYDDYPNVTNDERY